MILGVSLFLLRPDGKILVVKETEKKQWKDPGDYSIPMETKRANETYEDNIHRAIKEEACGITEYEIKGRIGKKDYNILNLALARCYLVEVRKHENQLTGIEVTDHQWMLPEEALELKLRPGARGMIEYFRRHFHHPIEEARQIFDRQKIPSSLFFIFER